MFSSKHFDAVVGTWKGFFKAIFCDGSHRFYYQDDKQFLYWVGECWQEAPSIARVNMMIQWALSSREEFLEETEGTLPWQSPRARKTPKCRHCKRPSEFWYAVGDVKVFVCIYHDSKYNSYEGGRVDDLKSCELPDAWVEKMEKLLK